MSLTNAIRIGHSALNASQIGLQVAGNNLANAATPGYSRQVASLAAMRGQRIGASFVGRGVTVQDIRRQVDSALEARLRASLAADAAAQQRLNLQAALEATLNELTDSDLSSQLNEFFNAWSDRANLDQSSAVVVQKGAALAGHLRRLSSDLGALRGQVDDQLSAMTLRAGELAAQVALLNKQIVGSELGGAENASLRDQRDQALAELTQLLDVTAVQQANGSVDVMVGSTPIVIGSDVRALSMERRTVDGELRVYLAAGQDQRELNVTGGAIGALLTDRAASIGATLDRLDSLAAQLAFEVNRLHSTGASDPGLTRSLSTFGLPAGDRALALNDPANATFAGLPFAATNGGFYVHVRHEATGHEEIVRIDVDLDGLTDAGLPGFDDDTSAADIIAALDAVNGISASFTADGRLDIRAEAGFTFSFADDTSSALAVLGVNAYFTGSSATDLAVSAELQADPSRLMVGRITDGAFVANGTAMEMVKLQDRALDALGGRSLRASWQDQVQSVAVQTETAASEADAAALVRDSLEAQRAAVSGVSIDEESINLMAFQRQYQGAARLISIADELLTTLMGII